MILIYAPYPRANQLRNGWMRRIAALERIFADRDRAYVFPAEPTMAADWSDYRIHTHAVAPGATMTFLDFRFSLHHRRLTQLVHEAELVYAHTSHSCQYLLPYYATGKIVTDLHGIAPEEEDLQDHPGRAAFFAGFEETMVRHSAVLVTVTQAMADHLHAKYPGSEQRTIRLPIVEDLGNAAMSPRPQRARPVVVYAGGLQSWQNVGRMLEGVAACRDHCEFRFYTDHTAELGELARAHGVADAVQLASVAPEELPAKYAEADFGFVLRDDITVNRVSCPTKLSEYLACGVIPIVSLAEIGDFAALGYRHVMFDDLLRGRLPDHATAAAMRRHNREVFATIQHTFRAGERELRELRLHSTPYASAMASTFLTTLERTAFFPVRQASIELERDDGSHRIWLNDLVQARVELDMALPGRGSLRALRVRPGAVPLVTTPIAGDLDGADGWTQPIVLAGGHTVDPHGNWCFTERDAAVEASDIADQPAERLRLRWEYLLVGPEALVTGAPAGQPRNGWLDGVRAIARAIPGARSAWEALQRLRRR